MNFEEQLNSIILGNNVDVLKQFPENIVDLTVSSPPYDQIRNYDKKLSGKFEPGKFSFDFDGLVEQLFRVTKMGGVVVWVVNDQIVEGNDDGKTESGNSFRQALGFMAAGFNLHDTMIYRKPGVRFPDSNRYHQCFEYMFVFSKGSPKTTNLIKDRKNKGYVPGNERKEAKNKPKRAQNDELFVVPNEFKTKLHQYGIRYNIWEVPLEQSTGVPVDEWRWHPAVFPSSLARDHIITWSNEGEVILDPFSGSGTTAKEAKKLGRKYIGIEINEKYVEKSRIRIDCYGVSELNSLFS